MLFLDEPTTGLDPSGRSDLWAIIQQLVGDGTTVLLTTQYLEEADRLADNIIVIDDGKIIAEGGAAQLKAGLGNTIVEVQMLNDAAAQAVADRLGRVGTATVLDDHLTVAVRVNDGGRSIRRLGGRGRLRRRARAHGGGPVTPTTRQ